MTTKIYNGDCQEEMKRLAPNSVDAIVTDPPYGLTSITKRFGKEGSAPAKYGKDGSFARLSKGFMGKEWDGSGIEYNVEMWQKCLRVLKPGGYLLAFGGTRTYHRIACAIEDAGFEIRDCIMWLYGSGFPKSMNIGVAVNKKMGNKYQLKEAQNEWKGWGTALKPSYEPIIVARKPFKGSLVDNVIKYGVGGINIDECRVGSSKEDIDKLNKEWDREWNTSYKNFADGVGGSAGFDYSNARTENKGLSGRFPANTILTYDETDSDEVCGGFPNTKSTPRTPTKGGTGGIGQATNFQRGSEISYFNDSGSAARYFYCAKASKKDREEGLEELRHNTHPTVKPTSLMQYLIRLVAPKGATILDPFMGSGSTGKAVMYENRERNADYKFIGIEKDAEYCKIAEARIEHAKGGQCKLPI